MKNKIILLTLLSIATLFTFSTPANAAHTAWHSVGKIQITDAGAAYFRPEGLGKWGGDECPLATYAYIVKGIAAYENIFSLAVASKLNGTPMQMYGTCSANGNYLLITYAHFR